MNVLTAYILISEHLNEINNYSIEENKKKF